MLQTSITKWLSKPKTVTQPDAVPLKPQQTTKGSTNIHPAALTPSHTTATAPPTSPPAPAPTSTQNQNDTTQNQNDTTSTTTRPPSTTTTTTIATLPPLTSNITLAPLTLTTLPSFRRLNTLLLPIPYPQKFYDEILSDPTTASISLAAFWNDSPSSTTSTTVTKAILIAGIRCRLLPAPPELPSSSADRRPHLYIATIATLSPYRAHGLATHLLAAVTRAAAQEHGVGAVYAHVWVANEEGRAWYEKRGFEVVGREEGYYRRLRPSGAWVVWRRVSVGDLLGGREGG